MSFQYIRIECIFTNCHYNAETNVNILLVCIILCRYILATDDKKNLFQYSDGCLLQLLQGGRQNFLIGLGTKNNLIFWMKVCINKKTVSTILQILLFAFLAFFCVEWSWHEDKIPFVVRLLFSRNRNKKCL